MAGLLHLTPGRVVSQQATDRVRATLMACFFADLVTILCLGKGRGELDQCNSGTVTERRTCLWFC